MRPRPQVAIACGAATSSSLTLGCMSLALATTS